MFIASVDARKWIFSVITAPVCLILIAATVLTGSRGGFMGIAVALATLFLHLVGLVLAEISEDASRNY